MPSKKITHTFIGILTLFTYLFFFFSSPVQAHMTESDQNISVMIHINPDDAPIARDMNGSIYFQISDSKNTFLGKQCDCTFSIIENGKHIHTGNFFNTDDSDPTASIVPYTFPRIGVYQVNVSGTPIEGASFQAFSTQFTVRVESVDETQPEPLDSALFFPYVLSAGVGFGVLLILFIFLKRKPRHL